MSNLSLFLKENKKVKENGFHAPTQSICDESGEAVKWEFRHISTKEDDGIRDECTKEVPVPGKPGMFRPKFNSTAYLQKLICESTVFPDLYDAQLQNSYGVKTPEELLYELVDDPGEFQDFCVWIQEFQGFKPIQDKVNDAKN